MTADDRLKIAEATYATLKQQARERYPEGHSYAMAGGKIVADGTSEQDVRQQVQTLGLTRDEFMIEQIRSDAVKCDVFLGWTLFSAMAGHLIRVMTPKEPPEGGPTGTN